MELLFFIDQISRVLFCFQIVLNIEESHPRSCMKIFFIHSDIKTHSNFFRTNQNKNKLAHVKEVTFYILYEQQAALRKDGPSSEIVQYRLT